MDIVFIEDLRIETVIGIYDWERGIRQTVALDVEMAFDNRVPAASDDIAQTLDYKAVSKRLIACWWNCSDRTMPVPTRSARLQPTASQISRRVSEGRRPR